MTNTFIFQIYF